jgi:outer membrane protein assembly factor BamE
MTLAPLRTALAIGLTILTLSACVYRMDIPQGNQIDAGVVEQLELGMSRNQVAFLLGTPAVVDLFQPDLWHYVYYKKSGEDGSIEKYDMRLTFNNDLLSAIDGEFNPG